MVAKHYSQFDADDLKAVRKLREQTEISGVCVHAKQRMEQRHILDYFDYSFFEKVLHDEKFGKVIEVRYDSKGYRLVLRSKCHVCGKDLIFSIGCGQNAKLITVYTNSCKYHHKNICMDCYDSTFKIIV